MDPRDKRDNNLAVYWHRPLGAPDVLRRLTIRRQQGQFGGGACWSCPISIGGDALSSASLSPPWRYLSSRSAVSPLLQILELDCPEHVDESFLASILDSVFVVADTAPLHDNALQQLRCLRNCHESVVRWFLQRFNWQIVELAGHNPTVLACLPHSIVELRLTDDLSIQDWQAIVRRGQQLRCQRNDNERFLLRTLWLEIAPRDPLVSTALLRHVIRDVSFVVTGPPDVMMKMEDLQWHSALNVWSLPPQQQQQGKARNGTSPSPLSGADTRIIRAVHIIKEWKRRLEQQQPDDGGPLVPPAVLRPGHAAVVDDNDDDSSTQPAQRGTAVVGVVAAVVGQNPPRRRPPATAALLKHNPRRTSGGAVYVCPHRR